MTLFPYTTLSDLVLSPCRILLSDITDIRFAISLSRMSGSEDSQYMSEAMDYDNAGDESLSSLLSSEPPTPSDERDPEGDEFVRTHVDLGEMGRAFRATIDPTPILSASPMQRLPGPEPLRTVRSGASPMDEDEVTSGPAPKHRRLLGELDLEEEDADVEIPIIPAKSDAAPELPVVELSSSSSEDNEAGTSSALVKVEASEDRKSTRLNSSHAQ